MKTVFIKKKTMGLHKVACDCGFVQFFTLSVDADRVGEKHAEECSPAIVTRLLDGKEELALGNKARPGRPAGGVNHNSSDARN